MKKVLNWELGLSWHLTWPIFNSGPASKREEKGKIKVKENLKTY